MLLHKNVLLKCMVKYLSDEEIKRFMTLRPGVTILNMLIFSLSLTQCSNKIDCWCRTNILDVV
jgi:hypothetical protein